MNTVIETQKLCKSFSNEGYQQHVLKNIDLKVYEGDFTVVMGPSGAGKSTLLYALSGMDKPSMGRVIVGGTDITGMTPDELAFFRRKNCGFVFQQIYLVDSMSILDNVMAAGLLTSNDRRAVADRAKAILARVDLDESVWDKFPTQVSGGEAQRAGIARALINEPRILFADEPTGALNSKTGRDVLDSLTSFNDRGQSILMVTHDIVSARRGNRILYVCDGEIAGECALGRYVPGDRERHDRLSDFLVSMGW